MKKAAASILVAVVLFAFAVIAEAQQQGKIPRIGFLGNSTAALEENLVEPPSRIQKEWRSTWKGSKTTSKESSTRL
jgi:hypothetical protein